MENGATFHPSKFPLEYIKVPLSKFIDEIIPFHQNVYELHRTTIHKLIAGKRVDELEREVNEKKRAVKQLKDLMYELDTLRTQVNDSDLDEFDSETLSIRKIILTLISAYTGLENMAKSTICTVRPNPFDEENKNNQQHPFAGTSQIQLQEDLNDIKLKQSETQMNDMHTIQQEVEELHQMYKNLNDMVCEQSENVEHVSQNVEGAQINVQAGASNIIKAHKLTTVAYPATGALLGGIIGGPIGLMAGLKVGGLAALGCALVGFTGGRYFKKISDPDNIPKDESMGDTLVNEDETQKKDI